jgi:hypothetical protein
VSADARRIAELAHEHAVSTTADPTLLDWWSVLTDTLSRVGFDTNAVVPLLELLRPYVRVVVPLILAALVVRLVWTARARVRPARPDPMREILPPRVEAPATLHLDGLLALDGRAALGHLWRHLARRVASGGHGQWRVDSTPGEFFRSLDPAFVDRELWRDFTRGVELGLYGPEAPTADAVRGWWERTASWR